MSRWFCFTNMFHISGEDLYVDLSFEMTDSGLAIVTLTQEPLEIGEEPTVLSFYVWDYELVNLIKWIDSHPFFAASIKSYVERYSNTEEFKTRSQLLEEIKQLKEENERLQKEVCG